LFLKKLFTMACTLSIGRAEQCKDSVGGLLAVYAIPYGGELAYFRGGGNVAPRSSSGSRVYPLAIKTYLHGNNTLDTEFISSRNEGTSFQRHTLILNLKKADAELYKMLRNSADRYFFGVVTRDKPDEVRFIGTAASATPDEGLINHKGAEISQIQWVSGASMGDFNGATVTITAETSLGSSNRGYAYGYTSDLTIFDPKLVDTYVSWTPAFNISSATTSIGDSQTITNGTYYNTSTGEVVSVLEDASTYQLGRGLMGTNAMDISTEHILYKIA
jgi:hypothetical protein